MELFFFFEEGTNGYRKYLKYFPYNIMIKREIRFGVVMISQLVITLREALEALLLVTLMMAYLKRMERENYIQSVIIGAGSALLVGIGLGITILHVYGQLMERSKALFEVTASLLAVVVLTYMIYWMAIHGRKIEKEVERKITSSKSILAVVFASFVFVIREVIETILFLIPFAIRGLMETILGAALGIVLAFIVSYGIFRGGMQINLTRFFYYSSILLILIAGGLLGYGIHEFIEFVKYSGGELGWIASPAYDLHLEETSPFHHEGGIVGSILAVLFGYAVIMEWLRLFLHLLYLGIALPLVIWVYSREARRKNKIKK